MESVDSTSTTIDDTNNTIRIENGNRATSPRRKLTNDENPVERLNRSISNSRTDRKAYRIRKEEGIRSCRNRSRIIEKPLNLDSILSNNTTISRRRWTDEERRSERKSTSSERQSTSSERRATTLTIRRQRGGRKDTERLLPFPTLRSKPLLRSTPHSPPPVTPIEEKNPESPSSPNRSIIDRPHRTTPILIALPSPTPILQSRIIAILEKPPLDQPSMEIRRRPIRENWIRTIMPFTTRRTPIRGSTRRTTTAPDRTRRRDLRRGTTPLPNSIIPPLRTLPPPLLQSPARRKLPRRLPSRQYPKRRNHTTPNDLTSRKKATALITHKSLLPPSTLLNVPNLRKSPRKRSPQLPSTLQRTLSTLHRTFLKLRLRRTSLLRLRRRERERR